MKKSLLRIGVLILSLSVAGGWIHAAHSDTAFLKACTQSMLTLLAVFAGVWVLFFPLIFIIRKWWRKKIQGLDLVNNRKAAVVNKFILNTNAMIGAIAIGYAILLFVCGHIIAPDSTPDANDQINEIAYKPPGFSVTVLKQPLTLQPPQTGFLRWMVNGKKVNYRNVPLNNYHFSGDSLYIERYIGEGIPGQKIGFRLSEITGKDQNIAANRQLIVSDFIEARKFYFGTDDLGRDYLSRIILGVRVSLSVGCIAVLIALFIGIPLGALAGFYKRFPPAMKIRPFKRKLFFPVDDLILWFINVIWAIPTLLLVFPIVFAFGQNFYTIFIAVGLTMWVDIARIVRGQVMQVREMEFVQAAKTFGFSDMRTIFRHILPNITGPVIVITAANFAYAILTEAGLSFLGIGVQPPAPSWGLMISRYKDNLITDPYLALIPGFSITVLVLAFFMVGNGLRDAFDIKSRFDH